MSVLLLILKILLWVLGIAACMIVIVLLLPIKLHLIFVEYFSIEVKVIGIKVFYFETKQKPESEETPEEDHLLTEKKKKKKKGKKEKEPTKKLSVKETVGIIKESIIIIFSKLKRYLKLEKLSLKVLVAADDAAKTAMIYPEVCAVGAWTAEYAENIKRKKKNCVSVKVTPDFIAEKSDIDFKLSISIRGWHIISLLITVRKLLKKLKGK